MTAKFPSMAYSAPLIATDYSGTSTPGESLEVMPTDSAAVSGVIQNVSAADFLYVNLTGGEAGQMPGSIILEPGGSADLVATNAVSVFATSAVAFTAVRYHYVDS
ncbi:MAG: hypothetical protein ACRCWW_21295 [Scandinavium sp.]|uniref:hypothetical protein n=1 Tax=Scandinavium sp. TaxID=2830653 RepID=UPI003F2F7085